MNRLPYPRILPYVTILAAALLVVPAVAIDAALPPVPQHRTARDVEGPVATQPASFTTTATAPLFEISVSVAPLFTAEPTTVEPPPEGLATMLAQAQSLWQAGDAPSAFATAVQLADQYPNIQWPDVLEAKVLRDDIARNADASARTAIEAALPQMLTSLNTAYGKECAARYYEIRAEEVGGTGTPEARPYVEKVRDAHWQIMQEHPNDLVSHFKIRTFLQACKDLGEFDEGEQQLRDALQDASPTLVAFSSWNYFAEEAVKRHDSGTARICFANVLVMADGGALNTMLTSSYVPSTAKAARLYVTACALEFTNRLEEALAEYNFIATTFTETPEHVASAHGGPVLLAGLRAARLVARMNSGDPYAGIQAYHSFAVANAEAPLAGQALLEMAGVYALAGDYPQAATYYREVLQEYPGTEAATGAAQELEYVLTNLYDSVEIATDAGTAEKEDNPRVAQRTTASPPAPAEVAQAVQPTP